MQFITTSNINLVKQAAAATVTAELSDDDARAIIGASGTTYWSVEETDYDEVTAAIIDVLVQLGKKRDEALADPEKAETSSYIKLAEGGGYLATSVRRLVREASLPIGKRYDAALGKVAEAELDIFTATDEQLAAIEGVRKAAANNKSTVDSFITSMRDAAAALEAEGYTGSTDTGVEPGYEMEEKLDLADAGVPADLIEFVDAILMEGAVSRAAARCGMTASDSANALRRLRKVSGLRDYLVGNIG